LIKRGNDAAGIVSTLVSTATASGAAVAQQADEWQAATEALLLVLEQKGPTMFARIGVMRALNRHVQRVFDSSRKETHWGNRKLARDR
jgi:hypothetical protein